MMPCRVAQVRVDLGDRARQPHHEFLEERLRRRLRVDRKSLELADLGSGVVALVEAELGHLPETALSHGCEIGRGSERADRGIGADVARRLGAADVLLARRKREHVAAPAVGVDRFADEMAGQPPHVRHARRENAEVRPAERRRNSKRLSFGDDHVGAVGAGRLEQAERDRIGHDDEQSAGAVHRVGQAVDRFALAEEVGILDDQRGGVLIEQAP